MLNESQASSEFHLVSDSLKNERMKTIEEIRQDNLKILIKTHGEGEQIKLIEILGLNNPAQLSQWVNASKNSKTGKPRSISSTTCRKIEETLGLERGWMDHQHDESNPFEAEPELSPRQKTFLKYMEQLSDTEKQHVEAVVETIAEGKTLQREFAELVKRAS